MDAKPWLVHYDPAVPAHLDYPRVPLFALLRESARKFPHNTCLIFNHQSYTYAEVNALSDAFARALVGLGVKKGQPVGIMLPNSPQFVVAFFGVLKAGGVVVAINPNYRQRELEFQIGDTGLQVMISASGSAGLLDSLQAPFQPQIRIFTGEAASLVHMADWLKGSAPARLPHAVNPLSLEELIRYFAAQPITLPEVAANDAAIYQYSGGTTGIPKAAVGLHRNLVANSLQFREWLAGLEDGREVFLTAIPLYHVYGMVIGMSVGIAMGAALVLVADARMVTEILTCIQAHRATFFPGVPNLYHAINQHPDVQAGLYDLRSIKACISGSAPLLQHIKTRFEALTGGKLVEGYGLSEAPTATHCNPVQGDNRAGSIGLPLPDVEARIVDLEDGESVLPPGSVGELIVRGPQVMAGYLSKPEETEQTIRNGWLYTGDIARMDADGYFYLVDRKKELIKVGGFQVWPREVEEVIALHPAVREVGVAGVPDVVRGEVVKAWIELKPGQEVGVEEIRAWCSSQLARYKVPTLVEFRGPLPRTPVGKLLRRELVREHMERTGTTPP